jgi:hypothetical protein
MRGHRAPGGAAALSPGALQQPRRLFLPLVTAVTGSRTATPALDAMSPAVGIAGVNTRALMRAADPLVGIAGNWGSTLRPHVARVVEPGASVSEARLGDQAALHAWRRACYLLDYVRPVLAKPGHN